ncbi:MAG: Rossmann-like and DUF2520 domain-containing protein [Gemmatimonadota bacterium]
MERLVFIGPGRVGLALGQAISRAVGELDLLYQGRRPEPPAHPLFHQGVARYQYGLERPAEGTSAVFLTVPDAVLPELAVALAARGPAPGGCAAFHTSGALGADPLAPLHAQGYEVGTFHPLQAIANPISGAQHLFGSAFAISGEPAALATARRLIGLLGGTGITVPTTRRPLYHAAAVFASNYLVALLHEAADIFQDAGATREEAERALTALARGTLDNVEELGIEGALTGPLLRGDVETVELHLRTLDPRDAALYAALGRRTLAWVRDRIPQEAASRLDELFERAP